MNRREFLRVIAVAPAVVPAAVLAAAPRPETLTAEDVFKAWYEALPRINVSLAHAAGVTLEDVKNPATAAECESIKARIAARARKT